MANVKIFLLFLLLFAFSQNLCGDQITFCTSNGTKLKDFVNAGKPSLRFQIEAKRKLERKFLCPNEKEIIVKKLAESMVLDDYHLVIQKESDNNNCSKIIVLVIANVNIESSSPTTVILDPITLTTTEIIVTSTSTTIATTTIPEPKLVRVYEFSSEIGTRTTELGIGLKNLTDFWMYLDIDKKKGTTITFNNSGETTVTKMICIGEINFDCMDERSEKIKYTNADKLKEPVFSFKITKRRIQSRTHEDDWLYESRIRVNIEVWHYFVDITMQLDYAENNKTYHFNFGRHWPAKWWEGLDTKNFTVKDFPRNFISINRSGLIRENELNLNTIADNISDRTMGKYSSRKFLHEFVVNSTITIRGIFTEKAKKFTIKLLRNTREIHNEIGDIVMQITIDFATKKIMYYSRFNKKDYDVMAPIDLRDGSLALNVPFECHIKSIQVEGPSGFQVDFIQESGHFSISEILSPHPIWAVNYLNLIGDPVLVIFDPPFFEYGKQITPGRFALKSPMQVGSLIDIKPFGHNSTATVSDELFLYLLHGVNEYRTDTGDVPLRLKVKYPDNETHMDNETHIESRFIKFSVNSLNRKRDDQIFAHEQELQTKSFPKYYYLPLQVMAKDDHFLILHNGLEKDALGKYYYNISGMRSWTVDHLYVCGKTKYPPIFEIYKNEPSTSLTVPFTRPFDTGEYQANKNVKIALQLKTGNDYVKFSINFLHGGIYFDEYVVQTLLRLEFFEDHLVIREIIDAKERNKKEVPYGDQNELESEKEIKLEIIISRESYNLVIKEPFQKRLEINDRLPPWLVEHLSVEGNVEWSSPPWVGEE